LLTAHKRLMDNRAQKILGGVIFAVIIAIVIYVSVPH
jgi:hypothetical protein